LISILMCAMLIDSEGNRVPWKIWVFGIVCGLGLSLNPEYFSQLIVTGWYNVAAYIGLSFFGLLLLTLYLLMSFLLVRLMRWPSTKEQCYDSRNHICAVSIVGIYLGPNLFLFVIPLAIAISVLFRILHSRSTFVRDCGPLLALFIAVLCSLSYKWI